MKKAEKKRYNFNLRKEVFNRLKKFCLQSGIWTMSQFIDVTIDKELKKVGK